MMMKEMLISRCDELLAEALGDGVHFADIGAAESLAFAITPSIPAGRMPSAGHESSRRHFAS